MRAIFIFFAFQCCLINVFGQAVNTKPVTGTITGQISGDGQKFSEISVTLFNANTKERRTVSSQADGSFTFTDVPVGVYQIGAFTSAYVSSFPARANNFRIGDNVSILLAKGGVITGKVLDSAGRPIVGTSVSAIRVRDDEGHLTIPSQFGNDQTDDRGEYRIYGLSAGTYIISAAPIEANSQVKHHEISTYYPSSTRDTAQEIVVQPGAEITGIDVTHRSEQGHSVSGTVNFKEGEQADVNGNVQLYSVASRAWTGSTYFNSNKSGFAFYGVPDGEYEVTATRFYNTGSTNNQAGIATPTKVKVRSADVTGVILNFDSPASLQGKLTLEKLAAPNSTCEISRQAYLEETLVRATKDDPELRSTMVMQQTALSANGQLSVTQMSPGLYRLSTQLPSDFWYLKTVIFPSKKLTLDVARQGIYVRAGENLTGLSMVIAEGAASVQGKIIAEPNQKLPSRIRVYAIPASVQEADNLTRYFEMVTRDSKFTFSNLAPGKYWLYAAGIEENEALTIRNPKYWEAKSRLQLRREAEAAKQLIELAPCQKVKEFALKVR